MNDEFSGAEEEQSSEGEDDQPATAFSDKNKSWLKRAGDEEDEEESSDDEEELEIERKSREIEAQQEAEVHVLVAAAERAAARGGRAGAGTGTQGASSERAPRQNGRSRATAGPSRCYWCEGADSKYRQYPRRFQECQCSRLCHD